MGDLERGAARQGSGDWCAGADRGATARQDADVGTWGDGAHTPEDLETLCEDAGVTRDAVALVALFEEGAVLAVADDPPARGRGAIAQLAQARWNADGPYIAAPRRVVQVRELALVVAERAINVMRRGSDGAWRYVIALHSCDAMVASGARMREDYPRDGGDRS